MMDEEKELMLETIETWWAVLVEIVRLFGDLVGQIPNEIKTLVMNWAVPAGVWG